MSVPGQIVSPWIEERARTPVPCEKGDTEAQNRGSGFAGTSSHDDLGAMPIQPPLAAIAYLVMAWGLQYGLETPRLLPPSWGAAGLVLVGAGAVLHVWAIVRFRQAGAPYRTHAPSVLVESGPYRFSRNPMYLGLTTILVGIGLLMGTLPFLLVPAVFLLTVNLAHVPREERALEEALGEPYREYRQRVRRWV